nr:uncharacterized protein LOC112934772 isoform X3 [Vulpes vulpes]
MSKDALVWARERQQPGTNGSTVHEKDNGSSPPGGDGLGRPPQSLPQSPVMDLEAGMRSRRAYWVAEGNEQQRATDGEREGEGSPQRPGREHLLPGTGQGGYVSEPATSLLAARQHEELLEARVFLQIEERLLIRGINPSMENQSSRQEPSLVGGLMHAASCMLCERVCDCVPWVDPRLHLSSGSLDTKN